jgi:hypothetical protein
VNVTLRDLVPANTTYVAGSTTLNGAAVADVAGGSPLVSGMPINPPGGATPGSMPADASSNQANSQRSRSMWSNGRRQRYGDLNQGFGRRQ